MKFRVFSMSPQPGRTLEDALNEWAQELPPYSCLVQVVYYPSVFTAVFEVVEVGD